MRRGKPVYYRKVRGGKKVRSVYCWAGERVERAALEDEARRPAKPAPPARESSATQEPVAPAAYWVVEPPRPAPAPTPRFAPPRGFPPAPYPAPAARRSRVARHGEAEVGSL